MKPSNRTPLVCEDLHEETVKLDMKPSSLTRFFEPPALTFEEFRDETDKLVRNPQIIIIQ